MKKAFDQTVRDLKREVNKKVLKVPGIEQKILDATSNEPWGPHGSNLADLAQATQNYHEYQIIMNIIWKRINDTGKNWRHVYKALTVLEYLVGHGSERVIDEIREHAYQISTLSNFQYIDSSGRDQGNNVRRKSQVLVALVNDKEKVQEIREKALANKDKFRGSLSTGGAYRPGGYGDRYGRDEDRNGYGRERDWGYGGDDRSGRGRRSYDRDGDRHNRESDERGGRDNYRDDDYNAGRGNGDYQSGPRRSFDKDRSYEDDTRSPPQQLDRKVSDKSLGAPPSYEEAYTGSENHVKNERNGIAVATPLPKVSSPPAPEASSPVGVDHQDHGQGHTVDGALVDGASPMSHRHNTDGFDEFDPRGSVVAPPATSSSEMDFFGSSSDPLGSLALVPVAPSIATSESLGPTNSGFEAVNNPFGDSPFKAVPLENSPAQPPPQGIAPNLFSAPPADLKVETAQSYDLGDSLGGLTYIPSISNGQHAGSSPPWLSPDVPVTQGSSSSDDVLNAILPQTGPTLTVSPQWPQETAAPMSFQSTPGSFLHHTVLPVQQAAPFTSPVVEPRAPAPAPAPAPNKQTGPSNPIPQPAFSLLSSEAAATTAKPQAAKKFETKSTVWTDTLNRGLVNLNISGPKTNPLADIGIDFESINRKEKLKERSLEAPVASTTSMGKAMGAGSGMGRANAGGMVRPNPAMMGSGMSVGMGMGGGYGGGGMNQPMALGMGMGMNMGSGQGMPMRPPYPAGMAVARPGMPGVVGYNPAMGIGGGGYGSQQPYGGRYR